MAVFSNEFLQLFLFHVENFRHCESSDDILALALERACAQVGLSIPGDISIIAFNNSLYAQMASPQLTTVDIHSYALGRTAANQIFHHMEDPNLAATKVIVPHTIVERYSCKQLSE